MKSIIIASGILFVIILAIGFSEKQDPVPPLYIYVEDKQPEIGTHKYYILGIENNTEKIIQVNFEDYLLTKVGVTHKFDCYEMRTIDCELIK